MLIRILMTAVLLTPSLSAKDTQSAQLLNKALYKSGKTQKDAQEFERLVPKSSVDQWTKLAKIVPFDCPTRVEIAFALAYYDVDYTKNLDVLTQPFTTAFQAKETATHRVEQALSNDPTESDAIEQRTVAIRLLASLYNYKHRQSTLTALVQLGTDGADSEDLTSELEPLWNAHHDALLEAADGTKAGVMNLYLILADTLYDRPRNRKARFRSGIESLLVRERHNSNSHIAATASRLLTQLKQHPSNWAKAK